MTNSTVSRLVLTALLMTPAVAARAEEARRAVHLPAQPLGDALRALGRDRAREILFSPQSVAGRFAPAVDGEFTTEEALAVLLQGSGLVARDRNGSILIAGRGEAVTATRDPQSPADSTIVVTGSRIRGAPIASRVLQIGREDFVTGGFGDLGAALRALPQNFAGGQNPGVGSGASAGGLGNQNITGGSQVNLRGLGGDATLTLLNGNRMAYGGFSQGVDVSAIPVDAIERIDVVADGASAIYGSDAVAGVVNVILRKPFDGLTARARLGQATRGGDLTQDYALTGGATWDHGSILASYDFRHNTAIQARQRGYTAQLGDEPYMLLPRQGTHSGLVRATQDLGDAIHLSVDGLYSARDQTREITSYGSLGTVRVKDRILSVAPGIDVDAGGSWTVSLRGVLSRDRTTSHDETSVDGTPIYTSTVCYCNSLASAEAFVSGPLVHLPAGAVKLVAGGGHRMNRFRNTNLDSGNSLAGRQRDTYAYGELFVPLVSADNARPLLRALSVSLAGRYDHYNAFGGITTPKLGVIYQPADAVELKFSWGRSFKAPTLLQQLQGRSATLIEAATLIGSDAPAGASALYTGGGAPGLDAERATSMSWSASFQPAAVPDLRLDLTYFRVRYRDRVVQPIGNFLDALNPVYAGYIVRNPTPAQVEAAVASSDTGVDTYGNVTRDLGAVAYIIDNHYTNVAAQKIQGLDAGLSYTGPLGSGAVSATLNASWLDSRQQNDSASPPFDLAGSIWNPARYRARASLGWEGGGLKAIGYLNYTGPLKDRRTAVTAIVRSTVTADLFLGYAIPARSGALRDVTLSLAVQNLFDTQPPYLAAAPYVEPYDSTNYSPIGRFVAVSIAKSL
jgi:iron complex outermembrane recepter protein